MYTSAAVDNTNATARHTDTDTVIAPSGVAVRRHRTKTAPATATAKYTAAVSAAVFSDTATDASRPDSCPPPRCSSSMTHAGKIAPATGQRPLGRTANANASVTTDGYPARRSTSMGHSGKLRSETEQHSRPTITTTKVDHTCFTFYIGRRMLGSCETIPQQYRSRRHRLRSSISTTKK